MIHKPMEKLWHISIKQQSSAQQYQYHQIEYPVLADCSLFIKSMHTTLSSVLIRACSQMLLEVCKR